MCLQLRIGKIHLSYHQNPDSQLCFDQVKKWKKLHLPVVISAVWAHPAKLLLLKLWAQSDCYPHNASWQSIHPRFPFFCWFICISNLIYILILHNPSQSLCALHAQNKWAAIKKALNPLKPFKKVYNYAIVCLAAWS